MEFQSNGLRHIITWQHIDNPDKTREFIEAHPPQRTDYIDTHCPTCQRGMKLFKGRIPPKSSHILGMTVCRIKVVDAEKTAAGDKTVWHAVYVGYAFRSNLDLAFNKREGRYHSLQDALSQKPSGGSYAPRPEKKVREAIWLEFNKIWPPERPEMTMWQKRYNEARAHLDYVDQVNIQLATRLKEMEQMADSRLQSVERIPHQAV